MKFVILQTPAVPPLLTVPPSLTPYLSYTNGALSATNAPRAERMDVLVPRVRTLTVAVPLMKSDDVNSVGRISASPKDEIK